MLKSVPQNIYGNLKTGNHFSKHTIPRTFGFGNNCFALGVVQEFCTHVLLYWIWVLVGNYIWICLQYFWFEVGNNGIWLYHTFGLVLSKITLPLLYMTSILSNSYLHGTSQILRGGPWKSLAPCPC